MTVTSKAAALLAAAALALGYGAASAASSYADIAALAGPEVCPANTNTSCPAGTTCCKIFMSNSGYGCCNLPNAVCCGAQGCCPSGTTCNVTGQYSSECIASDGTIAPATQTCTPGPLYPPSTTMPNMIAIGDSVSIGYTPAVIALLNTSIQVQHSPWAGGGGADDVGNGVNCQPYFLRTSAYQEASWDMISFNFGLHNLFNDPASEASYQALLVNFTDTLRTAQPQAKLVYVTTTPFMPDRYFGNMVVEQLNEIARGIMYPRGIPVLDLYSAVIAYCGPVYANCSICDDEYNPSTGLTCGYHYTPTGWAYLGSYLAPQYAALLGVPYTPPSDARILAAAAAGLWDRKDERQDSTDEGSGRSGDKRVRRRVDAAAFLQAVRAGEAAGLAALARGRSNA